jgi:hypothetical protein
VPYYAECSTTYFLENTDHERRIYSGTIAKEGMRTEASIFKKNEKRQKGTAFKQRNQLYMLHSCALPRELSRYLRACCLQVRVACFRQELRVADDGPATPIRDRQRRMQYDGDGLPGRTCSGRAGWGGGGRWCDDRRWRRRRLRARHKRRQRLRLWHRRRL